MVKAIWNGKVIAESSDTIVVESNHYFPMESLNRELFKESSYTSVCGWKGTASYFDILVDGKTNLEAAWYYPKPKEAVTQIQDHVAFWKGVKVEL